MPISADHKGGGSIVNKKLIQTNACLLLSLAISFLISPEALAFREPANALLRDAAWGLIGHCGLFYRYYEPGDPCALEGDWVLHSDNDTGVDYASSADYLDGEELLEEKDYTPALGLVERFEALYYGECQVGCDYIFLISCKDPASSCGAGNGFFRCDGFLEYCYEQAGRDITDWTMPGNPIPGCPLTGTYESLMPCCNAPVWQFSQSTLQDAQITLPWIDQFDNPVDGEFYSGSIPLQVQGNDNYDIAASTWMYSTDGTNYSTITTLYKDGHNFGLPDDNDQYDWNPPATGNYWVRAYVIDMGGRWSAPETVYISYSTNNCPELSDGDNSSNGIETQESCLFEVWYRDPDGDPPGTKSLWIDGSQGWTMTPEEPIDYVNGTTFKKELYGHQMGCGSHVFHFEFTGGCGETIRYPSDHNINGPEVESSEPNLSIFEPSSDDVVDSGEESPSFMIQWWASDPDSTQGDDLTLDLYWDTDQDPTSGLHSIPGAQGIDAGNGETEYGSFLWDMSELADGAYYVYGRVEDDCGSWEDDYSTGAVLLSPYYVCPETWGQIETTFFSQGSAHKVVADDNGTWHLFFTDTSPSHVVKQTCSTNHGESWDEPEIIAYCTDAAGNDVGIGVDGQYSDVVFEKRNPVEGFYELFHVRSSDYGETWSSEHQITSEWSRYPTVSTSNGYIHMAWATNSGSQNNKTICYSRSSNGGNSWEHAELSDPSIDVDTPEGKPALCTTGDIVHVAWTDDDNLEGTHYRRSTNNGASWEPRIELIAGQNSARDATICASGNDIYVAWECWREDGIFFAHSGNGGGSFSAATQATFDAHHKEPTLATYDGKVYLFREGDGDTLAFTSTEDNGSLWCIPFAPVSGIDGDNPWAFSGPDFIGVSSFRNSDSRRIIIHFYTDPLSIDDDEDGAEDVVLPLCDRIYNCAPNPFNPSTHVKYELHQPSTVYMHIYNLYGQLVCTLKNGVRETPGSKSVIWTGRDNSGKPAPTGVYLLRMQTDTYQAAIRMVLIK